MQRSIQMGGIGVWKPEMQDGQWAQQLWAALVKNFVQCFENSIKKKIKLHQEA